ncbi:MAG: CvpA family protein [Magnetospirillum sp.]|nr:CvpA family protein [Magnetospirillum sp.]
MFTFVDGIVAVVLLGSAGMAFLRGFVQEVLSIAAWVGAIAVALYGFPHAQPWFRAQIGAAWAADGLAFMSLFLVSLLAFSLATKAVSNTVRRSALNSVDSSLGFVFGIVRGAVLLSLAYMVAVWFIEPAEPPPWLAQAKTQPWLERGAGLIRAMLPEGFGRGDKNKREAGPAATGDLDEDSRLGGALALPQPAAPIPVDGKPSGYDKGERHEMDRLFQTNQ